MALERDCHRPGRAVTVLRHDQVGLARTGAIGLVGRFAVEQDDHVGVLLERSGFTEVREGGLLVLPLLGTTVQLRERDDGHPELLGEQLERTRELTDLLLTALDALTARHELEVVDDHHLEVGALLEAPTLGPDLDESHVRAVVDVERGVVDAATGRRDGRPVARVERALAHRVQRDGTLGAHEAHRDLAATHFEREEDGRQVVADCGGTGEVERERRLTEGGSRGDDNQLARVQAVGQVVHVGESGGNAHHLTIATAGGLDLFDGRVDGDRQGNVVLGVLVAVDRIDLGLRVVDQVECFALARIAHLDDARAGLDQAAQQGAFGDDRRVVAGVGSGRHDRRERVQVVRTARALQLARLDEFVGDRDNVGGLAVRVEREDGVEDQLVLGHVEIGSTERLDDVGDSILRQQHATESGLFGEGVVRGSPFGAAGGSAHAVLRDVSYRHRAPFRRNRPSTRFTRGEICPARLGARSTSCSPDERISFGKRRAGVSDRRVPRQQIRHLRHSPGTSCSSLPRSALPHGMGPQIRPQHALWITLWKLGQTRRYACVWNLWTTRSEASHLGIFLSLELGFTVAQPVETGCV
ncbi:DnaB helicase (modular protein) [Microbacterium sp. C448]|nr:DnaB helicase (modular protein) [Microbacterium sp. C448]